MDQTLSETTKNKIASKQYYKCANKPGSNLQGMDNHKCQLWALSNADIRGSFDTSGYKIDIAVESLSDDEDVNRWIALCPACYNYKTNVSKTNKKPVFKCVICDKAYRSKSKCNKHFKTRHMDVLEKELLALPTIEEKLVAYFRLSKLVDDLREAANES
jgi:hypothetical protein